MERSAVPYRRILFVCVNQREPGKICCAERDSEQIAEELKGRVKALGLAHLIRVSKSGCQDVCAHGPNIMVFPDHIWYQQVQLGDLDRILEDVTRGLHDSASPRPA